jgi:protein-disulfide isomerase
MNKQFLAVILVVVGLLVGIFALTGKDKESSGENSNNNAAVLSSHIEGKADSKVNLTEYGDFQCPACAQYYPIVKELKATYGDRVAFQFRNFPLVQIHPQAFLGSRAAEAASKQNKFFEMHDLLYENQQIWSTASNPRSELEGYAQQLSLDVEKFKTDMNGSDVASTINADVKAGQGLNINSTPGFVLNGKKLDQNPRSVDEFKKLLDDALAQNQ